MDFQKFTVLHNDHGVSSELIREALSRIGSKGHSGQHVVEFNRMIGFNNLVEVYPNEEFYELIRGNRPYASRFVRNRLPEPTDKLCIVWQRVNSNFIRIITAYFTHSNQPGCPDEPGNILRKIAKGVRYNQKQLQEAYDFWSTHAFVE